MKKSVALLLGCVFLSACVAHETNLQTRQEERDAALYQKRAQEGCNFVKDQAAYRECLLNTYYSKHPTTYETAELINGKSIAIVKAGSSFEDSVVTQVAPLPSSQPEIYSYKQTETTTMDTGYVQQRPAQSFVMAQEEVYTKQEVEQPTVSYERVIPVSAPVVEVKNKTITPVAVVPAPVVQQPTQEPTWWEAYQSGKPASQEPTCPCADPNDPCPQCYEK